jgi:hypothetical protein
MNDSTQPLIDSPPSVYSDYSTTVVRQHSPQSSVAIPPLSSILTIRASPNSNETSDSNQLPAESSFSVETYRTAHSSIALSSAAATEGGSTIREMPSTLVHRFTLLKPGAKRNGGNATPPQRPPSVDGAWNPFDLIFSSGLLTAKCDICNKRLGWKPVLECDDCGLRYDHTLTPGYDDVMLNISERTSNVESLPLEIAVSTQSGKQPIRRPIRFLHFRSKPPRPNNFLGNFLLYISDSVLILPVTNHYEHDRCILPVSSLLIYRISTDYRHTHCNCLYYKSVA